MGSIKVDCVGVRLKLVASYLRVPTRESIIKILNIAKIYISNYSLLKKLYI